jgi:hypothetical protein
MENGSYRALATRLMASVKGSLDCRLPLAGHHPTWPENRGVFTCLGRTPLTLMASIRRAWSVLTL